MIRPIYWPRWKILRPILDVLTNIKVFKNKY